ncbi:hypothetical protein H6G89_22605 [Oscillatoria sp. FACHB-1407]|uniref:hypothetical protein n=1 Tax=Oscillatoria sp. FACHB-1407 TaxID=2692847 RepID=UPI0016845928|nr:hypothetical protein [Oscillatoria sp. FACHB-1407]MBD2463796.1 hypothetical protein [Oscillatoria sp. FACHB-1407]
MSVCKRLLTTKTARRAILISTASLLSLMVSKSSAQSQVPAEIGLVFEGVREMNDITLTTFQYTGECPGRVNPEVTAWFKSEQTPPGRRRRVIIRNVTPGVRPSEQPFTNREYDEGTISESFLIEFGTSHSNRRFRVLEGENEFQYEILERRNVIESGRFYAYFENNVQTQARNSTFQTQQVCANAAVPIGACADVRTLNRWSCPDGNIVRQETIPQGPTRTTISNQMFYAVSYEVGGRIYRLQPGDEQVLTGNNFSSIVIIHPETGVTATRPLAPGARYRFTSNASGPTLSEWYNR